MDNRIWHPVKLPSNGQYYAGRCVEGKVEITPWTTAQEEMFVRYGGAKASELIDKLIINNVRLPNGMKPDELLITDRFFLLFQLRGISLVTQYTFTHTCPKCQTEHPISLDINNLKVKVPDGEESEPFDVKLPRCGKKVSLRLFRASDEKAMLEYESKTIQRGVDSGSPAYRFKLARQMEKIDGVTAKFDEKMSFISNLVWIDLQLMRKAIEKYETGLILDIEIECPKSGCSHAHKGEVPIQETFFRPLESDFESAVGMAEEPGTGNTVSG